MGARPGYSGARVLQSYSATPPEAIPNNSAILRESRLVAGLKVALAFIVDPPPSWGTFYEGLTTDS